MLDFVERVTANAAEVVYGENGVSLDDAAENYHEASKLYRRCIGYQTRGIRMLVGNTQLQLSATRSAKRYSHLPCITLPEVALPPATLCDLLATRRSRVSRSESTLALEQLAPLLNAAYGITRRDQQWPQTYRSVPSGGALYPLELYCAIFNGGSIENGLYHFDPTRNVLEVLGGENLRERFVKALPQRVPYERCAAVLIVTGVFWRSRFKYGQRGYRFTLLEAGHVGQNIVLASEALGLATVPVGGFYDTEIEAILDIDGVNESVLYTFSIGQEEA